jgi:D-sedoheptulose 7-phosphate isomerase
MLDFINGYRAEMARAFAETECTDLSGKTLDLSKGLEAAYQLVRKSASGGGKALIVGNGGSAAIASHIAEDFMKNGGVKTLAFNDAPLLTCLANDIGVERMFEFPVSMFGEKGDVLIAISSSGKSPNILNAAKMGLKKGCSLITFSGFSPDNPLRKLGAVNIYVPANGYAAVESAHGAFAHCLVDCAIEDRKARAA